MADDIDIMVDFTGDSSGLCHYLNCRFPLGLLAILLAIADRFSSSVQNVGGKIGAIFDARVGGMTSKRVKLSARMLPDAAPLVPMEAKCPKHFSQRGLACGWGIEPNPFADNLGQFILLWQLCPQIVQDYFRG